MSNFASRFSSLLITTERCFAENAVNGDQLKYEEERNLKERARKTRLKETKAEREREERQQLQGLEVL